ncbi:carbamoyltransferase N-terminal domain-containing protein [Hyphomicrobium sp. ghe19]|uniref:carbamoyltransferase family protein n=1 Tax=Hyphomicrobium sp. ghe19 TaxID=2682968 RepID=UPI001366CE96|nr:Decarbamoylnovobiocin carbamoyltransferase [Hyphomicrobium sp. ghe19]
MSVFVGVSAHYHDSACCVIKDGKLISAADEERFSRLKHDSAIPANAFRYCLREAKVSIQDITAIAYYEDPNKKFARQLWAGLPDILYRPDARFRIDPNRAEREIRQALGYEGPIEFVDHHLSHAASAYYFSGFPEADILTVDGVGEWATTTYGRAEGNAVDLFEEVTFPNSLGLLYSAVTAYLGFDVNDAEYKVMGLAPYGTPRYLDKIQQLFASSSDGQYRLDLSYFDFVSGDRMFSDKLCELLGKPPRVPESDIDQFHTDIASSLQKALEGVLLEKVRYLHDKYPSEHLCMAGGVALNCVANARIHREGPFKHLFVQPAASDSGGSLGAAAVAWARHAKDGSRLHPLTHVYLGPSFSNLQVQQIVDASPLGKVATYFRGDEAGLVEATAARLADGKVVGWFHGRMEFGPRALGSRSILADPRRPEMRDRINALVKMREAFRPFAPAVLEEKMSDHFDLRHTSPYMLETCQVTSKLDLPAITHVDGSARVQTVNRNVSPRFHALLTEFDRLTDCPILLNTSFNLRGDAIVMDPIHAMWCFVISNIDVLVMEDCLIDRSERPTAWTEIIEMLGVRNAKKRQVSERANVYSFL